MLLSLQVPQSCCFGLRSAHLLVAKPISMLNKSAKQVLNPTYRLYILYFYVCSKAIMHLSCMQIDQVFTLAGHKFAIAVLFAHKTMNYVLRNHCLIGSVRRFLFLVSAECDQSGEFLPLHSSAAPGSLRGTTVRSQRAEQRVPLNPHPLRVCPLLPHRQCHSSVHDGETTLGTLRYLTFSQLPSRLFRYCP